MHVNSLNNRMDHAVVDAVHTASMQNMVVDEHKVLAALFAMLLATTSGVCGQQSQCICGKSKAACRIACRAACCHGLGRWEMAELCMCQDISSASKSLVQETT